MFYSKSTKGFYTPDIHGDNIPMDVVEISDEWYQNLMNGQSEGLVVSPDRKGYPSLSKPIITQDQLRADERCWRDTELRRADVELNKVQDGMGVGSVTAWREYRCALRNLTLHELFPAVEARPTAPDAI